MMRKKKTVASKRMKNRRLDMVLEEGILFMSCKWCDVMALSMLKSMNALIDATSISHEYCWAVRLSITSCVLSRIQGTLARRRCGFMNDLCACIIYAAGDLHKPGRSRISNIVHE